MYSLGYSSSGNQDSRHSFASRALALGENLQLIGKFLGHRQVQTTARYAHPERNSVKAAAARTADGLKADMNMLLGASRTHSISCVLAP